MTRLLFCENFFSSLQNNGDCMEWTGYCEKNGYGRKRFKGKMFTTHRLAYFLKYGNIPDGLFVCHKCDNRKCCNPEHLFLGTAAVNMTDKTAKGRQARGSTHGRSAIPASSIEIIRNVYSDGFVSQRKIAEIYGVAQSAISYAISGRNWKHIS